MADVQINFFENIPTIGRIAQTTPNYNTLMLGAVYIPGSISFNSAGMIWYMSAPASRTGSYTVSIGLYSLTGGTLSLANLASWTTTCNSLGQQQTSWIAFSTSATQNVTPGIWWLGMVATKSTAGGDVTFQYVKHINYNFPIVHTHAGPFFRGYYSASVTALPASIATTDCLKEGASATYALTDQPYIFITA